MSKNWKFIARADIGTGGSDLVWKLLGMLDYRFTNWGSVFFGYKVLDYDYDNGLTGTDRYVYNATQQGLIAGIGFNW